MPLTIVANACPVHAAPGARARRDGVASIALLLALIAPGCRGEPERVIAPLSADSATAAPPGSSPPLPAPVVAELGEGSVAPEVTFTLQDGFRLSLALLKGKLVVVYFCPAASDPGCELEAQGLGAHWDELHEQHSVVIVGVTAESASSQQAAIARQKLPFDLATDIDHRIADAFGVPAQGRSAPRTFLVGKDGKIRMAWRTADPEMHARAILAATRE